MKPFRRIVAALAREGAKEEGLTLIEIMIVIAILGLLAAIISVNVIGSLETSRAGVALDQIGQFKTGLRLYNRDCGKYPSTADGLNALVSKPASCPRWKPYLEENVIPVDPWGNAFEYFYPGTHGQEMEIVSKGKDGELNTADDITSWNSDGKAATAGKP